MHSLKQLSLANLVEELTPEDYTEVARLPALDELRINWGAVGWPRGLVMPRITSLRLNKFMGNEDISGIPTLFPGLRAVTIQLAPDVTVVPEHVLEVFPDTLTVETTDSVI